MTTLHHQGLAKVTPLADLFEVFLIKRPLDSARAPSASSCLPLAGEAAPELAVSHFCAGFYKLLHIYTSTKYNLCENLHKRQDPPHQFYHMPFPPTKCCRFVPMEWGSLLLTP